MVNPINNRPFVIDYSKNRLNLYLIDIGLHILNFVYLFLFVMIIMNQQRDQFVSYCFSKEGILNWAFTIVSLMTLVVFILMLNESKLILDRRASSEDYLYYVLIADPSTMTSRATSTTTNCTSCSSPLVSASC